MKTVNKGRQVKVLTEDGEWFLLWVKHLDGSKAVSKVMKENDQSVYLTVEDPESQRKLNSGRKVPKYLWVDFHYGAYLCNFSLLYGVAHPAVHRIL